MSSWMVLHKKSGFALVSLPSESELKFSHDPPFRFSSRNTVQIGLPSISQTQETTSYQKVC